MKEVNQLNKLCFHFFFKYLLFVDNAILIDGHASGAYKNWIYKKNIFKKIKQHENFIACFNLVHI